MHRKQPEAQEIRCPVPADTTQEDRFDDVIIVLLARKSRGGNPSIAAHIVGEWLSLVEHLVRDQGVGGSNPLSPTILLQTLREIANGTRISKNLLSRHRRGRTRAITVSQQTRLTGQ
jgi:hypothetical protein